MLGGYRPSAAIGNSCASIDARCACGRKAPMNAQEPSATAALIALDRGLGSLRRRPIAIDPFAELLVPHKYARFIVGAREHRHLFGAATVVLDSLFSGRSRHVQLRTRYIDDIVEERARAGVSQVVLLGAGLDARAYRLNNLERTVVFEVDHPASQAYKKERAAALIPRAKEVRSIPVDLERESFANRLAEAGHDRAAPTTFVWEGVVMYLSIEAIDQTIDRIAECSAPGSTLVMTYWERAADESLYVRAIKAILRSMSEPLKSALSQAEIAEKLTRAQFQVEADVDDVNLASKYAPGSPQAPTFERLLRATRNSPASSVRT